MQQFKWPQLKREREKLREKFQWGKEKRIQFLCHTKPNSDHRHFRIFRKKQIRAARNRVPSSGTMYDIHNSQIHAMRKLCDWTAYSSRSGPETNSVQCARIFLRYHQQQKKIKTAHSTYVLRHKIWCAAHWARMSPSIGTTFSMQSHRTIPQPTRTHTW